MKIKHLRTGMAVFWFAAAFFWLAAFAAEGELLFLAACAVSLIAGGVTLYVRSHPTVFKSSRPRGPRKLK